MKSRSRRLRIVRASVGTASVASFVGMLSALGPIAAAVDEDTATTAEPLDLFKLAVQPSIPGPEALTFTEVANPLATTTTVYLSSQRGEPSLTTASAPSEVVVVPVAPATTEQPATTHHRCTDHDGRGRTLGSNDRSADHHRRHRNLDAEHHSPTPYWRKHVSATELRLHEATFRALGSRCRIVSDIEPTVMAAIHRLEDLEGRWSRFQTTSEVSLVNAYAGSWVEVSAVTTTLFARAAEAQRRTNGLFNPLMLNELISYGYDRSNELLQRTTDRQQVSKGAATPATIGEIEIEGAAVRIPADSGFDPGGLGKGLIADLLMDDLLDAGATWATVSLGGDIRLGGRALAAKPVGVQVDDPRNEDAIWGTTWVGSGGLATSSTMSRRWEHDGVVHHHLLDPSTGQPAESPRIAATVSAESAWWADVVAKSLIIDASIGADQLAEWNATALVFTDSSTESFSLDAEQIDR